MDIADQTNLGGRKVFCVGQNKTGTTSLEAALKNVGLTLGSQPTGELLIYDWSIRKFDRIIDLCKSAQAFQDIPFSLPYTFQMLDQAFPQSKFILSVRTNADDWYESLLRFHIAGLGKGRIPTPDDTKEFNYRQRGFAWDVMRLVYGINESNLYDESIYKECYTRHNESVIDYFSHRRQDLLVVNLADPHAESCLGDFLGVRNSKGILPHLNQTDRTVARDQPRGESNVPTQGEKAICSGTE